MLGSGFGAACRLSRRGARLEELAYMMLDDEIIAVEAVVHAASGAATEHFERATKDLNLGRTVLAHYKDFLDATLLNARSILARCREMGSASAHISQGLLAC